MAIIAAMYNFNIHAQNQDQTKAVAPTAPQDKVKNLLVEVIQVKNNPSSGKEKMIESMQKILNLIQTEKLTDNQKKRAFLIALTFVQRGDQDNLAFNKYGALRPVYKGEEVFFKKYISFLLQIQFSEPYPEPLGKEKTETELNEKLEELEKPGSVSEKKRKQFTDKK